MKRTGPVFAAFAVVTCGAALIGAGCGGKKASTETVQSTPTTQTAISSPYEKQMQKLGDQLSGFIQSVNVTEQNVAQAKDANTRDAAALQKLQRALRKAANNLDQIHPPADVKPAHLLLTKGVREYATELNGVIVALNHGDNAQRALSAILAFHGIKDMEVASQEILDKGYNILR